MRKKFEDLIGKKFGRLLVIGRTKIKDKYGRTYWICLCDCGEETNVSSYALNHGESTSCGCYRRDFFKKGLNPGDSSFRAIIRVYKTHAKNRNLDFDLSEEQFKNLVQQNCFYCGEKPKNLYYIKGLSGGCTYNGIDRVDNSKGYILENVVPCCKDCNISKNNRTTEEFLEWIKRVYKYNYENKN